MSLLKSNFEIKPAELSGEDLLSLFKKAQEYAPPANVLVLHPIPYADIRKYHRNTKGIEPETLQFFLYMGIHSKWGYNGLYYPLIVSQQVEDPGYIYYTDKPLIKPD